MRIYMSEAELLLVNNAEVVPFILSNSYQKAIVSLNVSMPDSRTMQNTILI